jgi:hypothetical protein
VDKPPGPRDMSYYYDEANVVLLALAIRPV